MVSIKKEGEGEAKTIEGSQAQVRKKGNSYFLNLLSNMLGKIMNLKLLRVS